MTIALLLFCLIAATAVGVAAGADSEGPVTVEVSDRLQVIAAGFSPKIISRTEQTPISLRIEGEVDPEDAFRAPAIGELSLGFDRAIEFHVGGIPICQESCLRGTETREALRACRRALIGEGEVSVRIASPDRGGLVPSSRALVFNGGEVGGAIALFVHFYLPSPISKAFVLPVTVIRHRDGRLGSLAVVKFPRIGGGAGAVEQFDLEFDRTVKVGGLVYDPISAICRDGKLEMHAEVRFEDGTRTDEDLTRACTPGR